MSSSLPSRWRQIQRTNFTCLDQLSTFLQLLPNQRALLQNRAKFPLNLPRRLAEKMTKGTLDDPIARQFLPLEEESRIDELFVEDPVEDKSFQLSERLLQKYRSRVLLVTTGACAMNCRYCFRKNYDYSAAEPSDPFKNELELIRADPDIQEVILSGGDPLSLSNDRLLTLMRSLSDIPHIKRLRIHTRFPLGIPERLDEELLLGFRQLRTPLWFVIHSNHPIELDQDVLDALTRLRLNGAILLNQSVLLKGVNDDLPTLMELCSRLVNHGIMPYYLHRLDRVQGASHFDVPLDTARELVAQLQQQMSGYGVPRFVQEIPGRASKTPL